MSANGSGISFWGDGNVLQLGSGDGLAWRQVGLRHGVGALERPETGSQRQREAMLGTLC